MEIGEPTTYSHCSSPPPLRVSRGRFAMLLLVLAVAAAVTANPGVALPVNTTSRHHPPLLDCTPAPAPSTHKHNDTSFRANLAAALAALPSAAAAAPQRSAIALSVEAGPDRAFARGLCFGAPGSSTAAGDGDCLACLTAAATDVNRGCGGGGGSRRAGVWRAGCFLAYADTVGSSAREYAFRGWFYAGPDPETAATLLASGGVCYGSPADCTRCLQESLRAAPALGWLSWLRGDAVIVVGYSCFLRVQKTPSGEEEGGQPNNGTLIFGTWVLCMLFLEALMIVVLFIRIIKTLKGPPNLIH